MGTLILAAFVAFGLAGCARGSSPTPLPTIPDVTAFLDVVRNPDGMPALLEPGVAGAAPQTASDPLIYRFADASGHTDGQIEDRWRTDDGRYWVNSFSYPPHRAFDAGNGDGGDMLVTDGVTVRAAYTQNGCRVAEVGCSATGGRQGTIAGYWVGAKCGNPDGGWVEFRNDAPTGSWAALIAPVAGSPDPTACPVLTPAYTRYRRETLAVPFRMPDGSVRTALLPSVISEHYAGASIAAAATMERVIAAQGVGRIAWEAWTTSPGRPPAGNPGIAPYNAAPAAGWYLHDRRVLTRLVAGDTGQTGNGYGWPRAKPLP